MAKCQVIPSALRLAAKTSKNPKWIGQILIALCTDEEGHRSAPFTLDEGQKSILAICREELSERTANREAARERKRRQRAKLRDRDRYQGTLEV